MFITNNRGYGLLEVLIAGAIGAIMMAGTMKSIGLNVQNAQVVRATMDDTEFRGRFKQKVTEDDYPDDNDNLNVCKYSLALDNEQGIGDIEKLANGASDTDALETGIWRDTSINIVKFELKRLKNTADDPKAEKPVQRQIVAYYKKEGLGELSTVGGNDCTKDDTEGCYFATCFLDYKLAENPEYDENDANSNKHNVQTCAIKSCPTGELNLENCGPGSYLRGWDDNGAPDCVSVAGLTADSNPCPFGTVLTGYNTDKSPPQAICTGHISCPTGKTLNPQGHCINQARDVDDNFGNSFSDWSRAYIENTFKDTDEECGPIVDIELDTYIKYDGWSGASNQNHDLRTGQPEYRQSWGGATHLFLSPYWEDSGKQLLKRKIDEFCNPRSKLEYSCRQIRISVKHPVVTVKNFPSNIKIVDDINPNNPQPSTQQVTPHPPAPVRRTDDDNIYELKIRVNDAIKAQGAVSVTDFQRTIKLSKVYERSSGVLKCVLQ